MSNFQQKLTELVNSPQAKKITDKVQAFADDPKTKEQIEKAKRKLAEHARRRQHRRDRRAAGRAEGRLSPARSARQLASALGERDDAVAEALQPRVVGRARERAAVVALHEDRRLPQGERAVPADVASPRARSRPRSARRARRA